MRTTALALALLLFASSVHADLFDRAVKGLFTTQEHTRSRMHGQKSSSRAVVRYPVNITRQQDSFKVSTPCGSWSLTPQGVLGNLKEMLDPDRLKAALMSAIQDSIQNLIGAVVSKLSMLTVCYAVPTLCDLTKHMQAVAGQLHNVRSLSCQQLEGMVNSVANSMVAGRTARCIQGQIQAGMSLNVAQRICASGEWKSTVARQPVADAGPGGGLGIFGEGSDPDPPGRAFPPDPSVDPADPDREKRDEQRIVRETLDHALTRGGGGNPMADTEKDELRTFAQQMVGEVLVKDESTGGSSGEEEPAKTKMEPELPGYRLHDYYESRHEHMAKLLGCAVTQIGPLDSNDPLNSATCNVTYEGVDGTPATENYTDASQILQGLSVPGAEVPPRLLRALYTQIQHGNEQAVQGTLGDLAGTMAMMRTLWMTYQLRDELEAGALSKDDQTEEERKQVLMRVKRLEREAERFIQKRELAERHFLPIVNDAIQEFETEQEELLPTLLAPDEPEIFGTQNPLGYGY